MTDNRHTWPGLPGASISLAIAEMAQKAKTPVCVITKDMQETNRLRREIAFFLVDTKTPIHHFPDWETLPYDQFSPHEDIVSQRLATLAKLPHLTSGIIIAPVSTIMHRLIPKNYLMGHAFDIKRNTKIALKTLTDAITKAGYHRVEQVRQHGEFAIRGAILDLFPMGLTKPIRIELFDDEIETIRTFDPETQLTIEHVNDIRLLPAHEFPLDESHITQFRQAWRSQFPGNPKDCPIYESVTDGQPINGVEYYLPLFYDTLSRIDDYLPENTIILKTQPIQQIADDFWHEITHRHEQLGHDLERPICSPQTLYMNGHELQTAIKPFKQIEINPNKSPTTDFQFSTLPNINIESRSKVPFHQLEDYLTGFNGRVLFLAESVGRKATLIDSLKKIHQQPIECKSWTDFDTGTDKMMICVAPIDEGFQSADPEMALICESDLFGEHVMQRRLRKKQVIDPDLMFRDLTELEIGAAVVHLDHGIGRYLGLQTIETDDMTSEYLTLEYADKDKIYVPISSLHLISRYTGVDESHASLQKLGNQKWQKSKKKAAEKIRDVAAELLEIYAKRAATPGYAFPKSSSDYEAFRAAFPFEETPDQSNAIERVTLDMQTPRSMDRLICGDVGFGKTEVAMQAAFLAAHAGKQVAVLAPTTLLAEQHYHNFKDRFADWPIVIGILSRLQTKKETEETLSKLKSGKIDIVVGTHRILSKDIAFKDLGLLIVDEEHRFGVRQKDQIKALRAQVDILTLTATPIPRTLNLAMAGTRDLSIIATPPAKRLAVKTFVYNKSDTIIREAVTREILRGGQVYFLHNDVATIEATTEKLRTVIPEAKIQYAHGQMRERQLEKVMSDFYHQRFNLLICTTIIESGIDIPSANTIIIDKADRFGLAQLHQLRGRVGRSHHQAYAYLLVNDQKSITKDAKKRLEAITELDALGAGFSLATHDLEIRGAGEILGDEQSGHMQAIGFTLYMDLLNETVKALQAGKTPPEDLVAPDTGPEIDIRISTILPNDYIPDVATRLTLYKKLSQSKQQDEVSAIKAELIDRFGLLPAPAESLIQSTYLKIEAQTLGIQKIEATKKGGTITFQDKANVDPRKIITLIQQQPDNFQLIRANQLRFALNDENNLLNSLFMLLKSLRTESF